MPQKKSKAQILSEFYEAHGDYYDYSKVEYVNSLTKVKIVCPKHGEFEILPGHHKNGVGCRKCYFDSQKISQKEFIKRSQEQFGNRYDYSFINDLSSWEEKVEILCKEHNQIFQQEPRNHMRGHTGCPICKSRKLSGSREKRGSIKTSEELVQDFVERAKEIHENIYDYTQFEYVNAATKGKIICSIHGEFWQSPSNHLRRKKCPMCSKEEQKESTFKKLCKEKDINYHRALKRRQAGLSEEKVFEEGFIGSIRETKKIKVFGKEYPNMQEAVRELQPSASSHTISRWIRQGLSPEEAFERIPNPGYAEGLIYKITNKITEKIYIGLTIQTIERRWQYHVEQANANQIKSENSLHAAIRQYGVDAFTIEIIDKGTTKKDLEEKERYWIRALNTLVPNGYNISTGGVSGGSHKKPTTIDGILFESVKKAAEYLAESRKISVEAAEKRIFMGRIDIKSPAKRGQSLVKTKAYKTWSRIIHCVSNPNSKGYIPNIKVHEDWKDFDVFFKDVGNPPEQDMVFCRLNKTLGFSPDNCAWLTKSEARNLNTRSCNNENEQNL